MTTTRKLDSNSIDDAAVPSLERNDVQESDVREDGVREGYNADDDNIFGTVARALLKHTARFRRRRNVPRDGEIRRRRRKTDEKGARSDTGNTSTTDEEPFVVVRTDRNGNVERKDTKEEEEETEEVLDEDFDGDFDDDDDQFGDEKLLTSIEADHRLALAMPTWSKVLFMLTNLPYWMVTLSLLGIILGYVDQHDSAKLKVNRTGNGNSVTLSSEFDAGSGSDSGLNNWCFIPEVNFVIALLVASTSTLMHSSQVRSGDWCCAPGRAKTFHDRSTLKKLKLTDIFCASSAFLLSLLCHDMRDLFPGAFIAIPTFFVGIFLKRWEWHYTYLVCHGVWHIATAVAMFNVLELPILYPQNVLSIVW